MSLQRDKLLKNVKNSDRTGTNQHFGIKEREQKYSRTRALDWKCL